MTLLTELVNEGEAKESLKRIKAWAIFFGEVTKEIT